MIRVAPFDGTSSWIHAGVDLPPCSETICLWFKIMSGAWWVLSIRLLR